MRRIPRRLTPHTVHVEPVLPDSFGTPGGYAPMVTVGEVQVVDSTLNEVVTSGSVEQVSSAQVGANAGPDDYAFRIGDRVTLWKGTPRERTETVQNVAYGPQTGRIPAQQIVTLS